jgi:uncharacterized protein (TIGR02145 family)
MEQTHKVVLFMQPEHRQTPAPLHAMVPAMEQENYIIRHIIKLTFQTTMKKVIILIVFIVLSDFLFAQFVIENAVKDVDGNSYNAVKIGNQIWMKENLRTTKYCNGDPIELVTDSVAWPNYGTGAFCNYRNDENIAITYGRMYNYYAVADQRKLCPTGWHVPTDSEWEQLCQFLGGNMIAGGKMKEAGTAHWLSPNEGATNESGFTALPAGRQYHESFCFLGEYTNLWSSTEFITDEDTDVVWCRYMSFSLEQLCRFTYKKYYGLSVRCVKD